MISVGGSKEVQAALLAMKYADKELRTTIYARTREQILGDWTPSVQENINAFKYGRMHSALLMKSTTVSVGTQGITVNAATSGRKMSGGLVPKEQWYLAELGANPKDVQVRGRRGMTSYTYKRKVNTGFLSRRKNGRFADKAAQKIVARSVAMWVQTIVKSFSEAVEGK
jgi:hypothetical protein